MQARGLGEYLDAGDEQCLAEPFVLGQLQRRPRLRQCGARGDRRKGIPHRPSLADHPSLTLADRERCGEKAEHGDDLERYIGEEHDQSKHQPDRSRAGTD